MFLEFGIALCFLFFAAVWFYSQRRDRIEILQLEFANFSEKGTELAQEKQPIILRGAPVPPIFSQLKASRIQRLHAFPLQTALDPSPTLQAYCVAPASVLPDYQAQGRPLLSHEASLALADELALATWTRHTFQDSFSNFTGLPTFLGHTETRALLGGFGMLRLKPVYTCFLITEGTYTLSLVSKASEEFLPKQWLYRYPDTLTMNDTPLVSEIQFIEVILRPGTLACVPAHTICSMKPASLQEFHSAIVIDVDTPISNLSKLLAQIE